MPTITRYDDPKQPWIRKSKMIKVTSDIDNKIKLLTQSERFHRNNNRLAQHDIIHEAIEYYWRHPGIKQNIELTFEDQNSSFHNPEKPIQPTKYEHDVVAATPKIVECPPINMTREKARELHSFVHPLGQDTIETIN